MRADSYLLFLIIAAKWSQALINEINILITTQVIADRADMIGQADIVVCDCNRQPIRLGDCASARQGIFIVDGVSGRRC